MEMEKMIELIDAVSKSDLTGFKYEEDGIKLHLSKKENTCYVTENVSAPVNMTGTASAATVSAGVVSAEMGKTNAEGDQTLGAAAEEAVAGNIVESPLVGTFYSAPAEDAESFVKVGDRVEKGTLIATPTGLGANIFSSAYGVVEDVLEDRIIIKPDEEQKDEYVKIPEGSKLDMVKAAGVVGMGGAGFPTQVKLAPKEPEKIDHILVNGAECEPYLTSDYRRMLDDSEKLIEGLRVMLKLFDNAKGYICIEDNKPDCIAKLKEMVKDIPRIEVAELMTKYPQGGERFLIKAVTDREINSAMLPADAGCVVDNVDTVIAVYEAVILGKPVMDRIVTVTGQGIKNPQNFDVLSGTDMAELIEAAGGLTDNVSKVISGGPMMGFAMYDTHVPCIKTSSACLCLEKDDVADAEQTACINCGRCVGVCPGHVIPARLATFAEHGDMESFQKFDGMECCECGSCTFICPAHRPLTQAFKEMRKAVMAARRKKA